MKRYYEFELTDNNNVATKFVIDITKITYMSHDPNVGMHGETTITHGSSKTKFSGGNNIAIYNTIIDMMREYQQQND